MVRALGTVPIKFVKAGKCCVIIYFKVQACEFLVNIIISLKLQFKQCNIIKLCRSVPYIPKSHDVLCAARKE